MTARCRLSTALSVLLSATVLPVPAVSWGATARGAQDLIPCGHWIYDALEAIALEARVLNFSDSAPVTIQYVRDVLAEFDYDALSELARAQYDRIEAYCTETALAISSDLLYVGIEPTFNLEGYYKTNGDIAWTYDRYNRGALIDAPIRIGVRDWVTMSATMVLQQTQGAGEQDGTWCNIPFDMSTIDTNFPHSAYFSAGVKLTPRTGVQLLVNQGTQSIGRTLGGSIIISDYLTGTTYAKLSAYSPAIRYSAQVAELNVDKYYYGHELNVRFFKRFSVTLEEGLLVYAPLELRYLTPWTIYHGFAAWRDYGTFDNDRSDDDPESHTCDYLGVKLEYTPFRGGRFYGLFCMTQYQTPYEKKHYSDSPTPDGLGFQGGTEWYVPLGSGYLHLGLEGTYTQPFLYIKESPNWSMVRTYSEIMQPQAVFYEWIGSPFGPDTVSAMLTAGYSRPGLFSLDTTYLFMARGELSGTHAFDSVAWGGQQTAINEETAERDWPYPTSDTLHKVSWTTPTGVPEYVNRLSVRGTWRATPWLRLCVQPAYVVIFNRGHVRGETARGFEIALAVEFSPVKLIR